jgi:hypothetical protein
MKLALAGWMRSVAVAHVLILVLSSTGSAQDAPTTLPFQCENCPLSGQRPAAFEVARLETLPRITPTLLPVGPGGEGIGIRSLFIARVLRASPLMLEVLDSRVQQIDGKMRVLMDDVSGGRDVGTCGVIPQGLAVASELAATVASLRFNDLVRGAWLLHQAPAAADSPLGMAAVTELRKLSGPLDYFHPTPATTNCLNRSGRLVQYVDRSGGLLTVYNDGGLQYSTGYGNVMATQGLSNVELRDLLAAFGAAGVDAKPDITEAIERVGGRRLTLMAARYQAVHATPSDTALAPVVDRLHALRDRTLAQARFVLKFERSRPLAPGEASGAQQIDAALRANARNTRVSVVHADGKTTSEPLNIDALPELVVLVGASARYVWPSHLPTRLATVAAGGRVIPWSEIAQHKAIYYALLRAGTQGLTLVEGDRVFEQVRLCQISPDGHNSCGPAK